ncbi:MAG: DNA polymerase II large subunit [Candidatus Anstonellales archaeon]
MLVADEEMQKYFSLLRHELESAYEIASLARKKGFDPACGVEIKIAEDVAGRVEGIVGPPGIAQEIRKLESVGLERTTIAYEIVKRICAGEFISGPKEKLIDQAVRTGVGILTEGVLVAPTEGIAKIRIIKNQDDSECLALYFAGPIRSAGGTIAALSVVLGDVARRQLGIGDFRATDDEIERYVEECEIYNARCARLQYKPPDEHIRHIIKNCPVCIEGEPTEKIEVAVKRDLKRLVKDSHGRTISEDITNRIRGGIALVVCEGIAQKASKVLKYAKKFGLDWDWLEAVIRIGKKEGIIKIKPNTTFLDELVAGRPIFAYPMQAGGFRLRYGRTRATGIMAKAVHPATMVILDSFLAVGTQMKVERPGKGCVVSPCDSIEGPVVKLLDGSVVKLNSTEEATAVLGKIDKILFLGDLLVSVGDFIKSNHPLIPSAWCFEWYSQICASKGIRAKPNPSADEAFRLSEEHNIPLHPLYTYFWHDITEEELLLLAKYLLSAKISRDWLGGIKHIALPLGEGKEILEKLCVLHTVSEGEVIIGKENALALLKSLGLLVENSLSFERFDKIFSENRGSGVMSILNKTSGVIVKEKAPTYIGARMGRPEKAKRREMKPPVHVLFPLGRTIKHRSIIKTYKSLRERPTAEGHGISVEIARLKCSQCSKINVTKLCSCGGLCDFVYICPKCGKERYQEWCSLCNVNCKFYEERPINFEEVFEEAKRRLGITEPNSLPDEVKGVKGLISTFKIPERIEKGILRAKHKLSIFRDGTCRFDSTDVPLTHFYPREIGTPVSRLKELGYTHDYKGEDLKSEDQLVELKPQDIILSQAGGEYFTHVAAFIDDLLVSLYGLEPYYKIKSPADLVGKLFIGISPHTSAGILCRLIGFTKARVGFAHPYFHTAKRRNADGDEDSLILLLDALLNFSLYYVPESRGGTMDATRVLTAVIDPLEVDDESHSMEICNELPLAFYEASEKYLSPSELTIKLVKDTLGTQDQYRGLLFTHQTSSIDAGPLTTTYIKFKDMEEKVDAQLSLERRLRSVDVRDVAERIILSHFLPDLYGNLRAFSRQKFRCVSCNEKYRRIPLVGKCTKCGDKLLLTVNRGGIEKYLEVSKRMIKLYELPSYLKQRLELLEDEIESIFVDEKSKQSDLSEFM